MITICSYAISIVLCSLTLVVIVVLIVGLVFGAIGFRTKTEPEERTSLSNCGGIILLMLVWPYTLMRYLLTSVL